MKNIFKRKKDRVSEISPPEVSPTSSRLQTSSNANVIDAYQSGYEDSIALSETVTLLNEKKSHTRHTELQETFDQNFTQYLPFVVRRLRLQAKEDQENRPNHRQKNNQQAHHGEENAAAVVKNPAAGLVGENGVRPLSESDTVGANGTTPSIVFNHHTTNDDDATIVSSKNTDAIILGKPTSVFNFKRDLVYVNELLKSSSFIFPSLESFELFRNLRKEKPPKNSTLVYEHDRRQFRRVLNSDLLILKNYVVDTNQHIIPPEFKTSGLGMPLFKVQVPYLSSFRKNAPFLILKKYREIPLLNSSPDSHNKEYDDHEDHETYIYCTVKSKYFHKVRRLLFEFKNEKGDTTVKFLAFQNNFRSFTDFHYKGTRFRIIGTSTVASLAEHLPNMKLLRIDDGSPSLCDDIVNKRSGFGILTIIKKRGSVSETTKDSRRGSSGESGSRHGSVGEIERRSSIGIRTGENGNTRSPIRATRHGSIGNESYDFEDLEEPPEFSESNSDDDSTSKPLDPADYENPHPNPNCTLLEDREFRFQAAQMQHISNDLPPFGTSRELSYYGEGNGSFLPKKFTETGKIELYQDYLEGMPRDVNSTLAVDQDTQILTCVLVALRETGLRNSTRTKTSASARVGLQPTTVASFM